MSELDIELQKQTANVSVNEIIQEIDIIQEALGKDNTQEHLEGEEFDGK